MPRWDEKKYQCFVDSGSVPKSANETVFNSIWLKKNESRKQRPFHLDRDHIPKHFDIFSPNFCGEFFVQKKTKNR